MRGELANYELWIVNWAQAASLRQRGVWATRAIMGLVGRVGQVGRGENRELWIGHNLQACASGGIVPDKGLKEKPVLESSISNKKNTYKDK